MLADQQRNQREETPHAARNHDVHLVFEPAVDGGAQYAEDLAVAQDLKDTLDAHRNGCVGMAANMIGVSKSIIAFVDEDFGGRIFVMFNPTITAKDGAYDASEGCLSLKGERRTVRFQRIEVSYADRKFRERHATFTGFTAQIIQHEIDHCEGIII